MNRTIYYIDFEDNNGNFLRLPKDFNNSKLIPISHENEELNDFHFSTYDPIEAAMAIFDKNSSVEDFWGKARLKPNFIGYNICYRYKYHHKPKLYNENEFKAVISRFENQNAFWIGYSIPAQRLVQFTNKSIMDFQKDPATSFFVELYDEDLNNSIDNNLYLSDVYRRYLDVFAFHLETKMQVGLVRSISNSRTIDESLQIIEDLLSKI